MIIMALLLAQLELKPSWTSNLTEKDVYRSRALAVSDDGVTAVIDRDANQVVYLHPDGRFKLRIEKTGQGPGEMSGPVEITWSKAHQAFFIVDFNNSRFSIWDSAGKFVKEIAYKGSRFFSARVLDQNTAYFSVNSGGMAGDPYLIRYNLETHEQTRVWEYKAPPVTYSNGGTASEPIRVLFRWDPQTGSALGSNFLAVSYGDRSLIHILDFNGKKKRAALKPRLPRFPVTDAQIEDGIWHLPTSFHNNLRAGVVKPEGWPYIMTIHTDPEDRIWVIGGAPDLGKPHKLAVYSVDGKLLGEGSTMKVPNYISGDGVYFLRKEPDGGDLFVEKLSFQFKGGAVSH